MTQYGYTKEVLRKKKVVMDYNTVVTLLTIAIVLLSAVIVVVIIVAIILLIKIKKLVTNISHISRNVATATEWLSPFKLFTEAAKVFSKRR